MNKNIYEHLKKYCSKNGFEFDGSARDILETLQDSGERVYCEDAGSRRWWKDTFEVVDLDGMLIGFSGATTTGDDSPTDKGWEFDPETCCEVEMHTETKIITTYRPI
jgi:hypothetical protein